jgi:hypothetical protein
MHTATIQSIKRKQKGENIYHSEKLQSHLWRSSESQAMRPPMSRQYMQCLDNGVRSTIHASLVLSSIPDSNCWYICYWGEQSTLPLNKSCSLPYISLLHPPILSKSHPRWIRIRDFTKLWQHGDSLLELIIATCHSLHFFHWNGKNTWHGKMSGCWS